VCDRARREGNVTVVMAYSWEQFKKIATNPSREFLYETATMVGLGFRV
jgi:TAG lipase/steryl ester hydrolase/phospholipase A2/LPA acyltransferase